MYPGYSKYRRRIRSIVYGDGLARENALTVVAERTDSSEGLFVRARPKSPNPTTGRAGVAEIIAANGDRGHFSFVVASSVVPRPVPSGLPKRLIHIDHLTASLDRLFNLLGHILVLRATKLKCQFLQERTERTEKVFKSLFPLLPPVKKSHCPPAIHSIDRNYSVKINLTRHLLTIDKPKLTLSR